MPRFHFLNKRFPICVVIIIGTRLAALRSLTHGRHSLMMSRQSEMSEASMLHTPAIQTTVRYLTFNVVTTSFHK